MDDRDFRFKLDCAPQDVTPKALSKAVSTFARMLSAADAPDWRISHMELHSIDLAAKPVVVDERTERSFATLDTITRLATRNDVSRDEAFRFSGVLSALSDLAKETNANITVSSNEAEGTFTPGILTGINRLLLRGSRRSFGHVCGTVDKVILQATHRTLGLVDHVTQSRVDVKFGPELDPIVKRIQVGMEVDARGFVRAANGEPVSVDADDLKIIAGDHRPPVTAEDLEGIISLDFTGGLGSIDFASALRETHDHATTTGGER